LCYRSGVKKALVLVLALAACKPRFGGAEGPAETLRAYAQALEEGRAEDAYRLLSDDAKRSVSLEAFRRMVKENPEDVREMAHALARPASDPVVTATVHTPSGEKLDLLFENGAWTIDGAGVDRYGQTSPRAALVGFLRAYDRQRYDVIMRYVPEDEREGRPEGWSKGGEPLTADKLKEAWTGPQKEYIAGIVQAIKAALPTAQIEETQDNAAMAYGAGGTVSFLREHGLWKIKNLK
jgi:hypothetical protein